MLINKTTQYRVKYVVEYFETTEGGMETEQFGDAVDELPEALELLDIAEASNPNCAWIITLQTTKVIK